MEFTCTHISDYPLLTPESKAKVVSVSSSKRYLRICLSSIRQMYPNECFFLENLNVVWIHSFWQRCAKISYAAECEAPAHFRLHVPHRFGDGWLAELQCSRSAALPGGGAQGKVLAGVHIGWSSKLES